jgi:hypothetical protein
MTTASENRAIALRWLNAFWGQSGGDTGIVDDLSAPDVVLQCAIDEEYRGRQEVMDFRQRFRQAIPDFHVYTGDATSERDTVILRWEGSGTHVGPAFEAMQFGPLSPASRQQVMWTGHSAISIEGGKVVGEAVWSTRRQAQMQKIMLRSFAL